MRGRNVGRRDTIAANALALITIALYWWIWGAFVPPTESHDEAAYLLQARIFASGKWIEPARPLPEFFEQFHVLVTPVLAAKYPPGHSLLLVPGVLAGFPPLVPLVLAGLSATLLFVLVRRLTDLPIAFLAWLFWLLAPLNVRFYPSYLSEVSTATLWLLGWWSLLRWWEGGQRRWLIGLSLCAAWMALCRPLTAVAFALPSGVVVLTGLVRRRSARGVVMAVCVGGLIAGILPLSNARTTGDWRELPFVMYSRMYMPWDRMGFGFDSTPPARQPSPEVEALTAVYRPLHEAHTLANLPGLAGARALRLALGSWGRGGWFLLPLAAAGLWTLGWYGVVPLTAAALLLVLYLAYAHPLAWMVYYLEAVPVLVVLLAVGAGRIFAAVRSRRLNPPMKAGLHTSLAVVICLSLCWSASEVPDQRRKQLRLHADDWTLENGLRTIGARKAIVFVHYGPGHIVHQSLIRNEPDLEHSRIWLVHDFGPADSLLLNMASDRTPYLYDEEHRRLLKLR